MASFNTTWSAAAGSEAMAMAMAAATRNVLATLKEFGRGRCAEPSPIQPCWTRSRISRQPVGPRQWHAWLMPRSESFEIRGPACANSASSCSESWPFSGREQRKLVSVLNQGEQRIAGVQVAAVREERDNASDEKGPPLQGEKPPEPVPRRWTLEQLDQQLKFLSSQESSLSRRIPGDLANREKATTGRDPSLQWPTFSTEFFVITAVGLLLLTIFNNVMYKTFLGNPVVDRRQLIQSSVPASTRYRVTTRQEEREAREARDAQRDVMAAQPREAPSPSG